MHVAVKLEDEVSGHPGLLVKVIDVLGDNAVELSQLVQLGDGVVGGVGLCFIR